ncbi:Rubredoxin domain [Dillenia turbinata]|uniref:Rubredoxin domain n=1 Tax=Dillenia turbinata TaxID=194707 RepID=A0AAN8UGP8_9MAGN
MACATSTAPTFSFHLSASPKPKPHFTILPVCLKTPKISPIYGYRKPHFAVKSVDVSKEDKPTSEPPISVPESSVSPPDEAAKFDKRRLEEKFAVLNTGIYECRSCGYRYDEEAGDPTYPIPAGLPFDKMPEDWRCPTCGAAKSFFESKSVEIAGFAQNQQFGLGGNALTSGQKAVLIWGSLFFFFVFIQHFSKKEIIILDSVRKSSISTALLHCCNRADQLQPNFSSLPGEGSCSHPTWKKPLKMAAAPEKVKCPILVQMVENFGQDTPRNIGDFRFSEDL